MDGDESTPAEPDPTPTSEAPARPLSGIRLWLRLILSVLLSPLIALGFAFDTVTTGSAGSAATSGSNDDDAKFVDWWYEPFKVLSERRSH